MKPHALLAGVIAASLILIAPAEAQSRRQRSEVGEANAAALQGPREASLVGALHEFAYQVGALYSVQAAPQRITDIALEPGESLLSVSAGDTTRWIVGDARSGVGRAAQAHVLVKPNAAGLSTNLIIMTDRRVYHVELRSVSGPAMAAVSWRYPDDLTLSGVGGQIDQRLEEVASGVPVEGLNFRYRISGDRTDWRPLRAFDDGRRVFIQMPEGMEATDAPPLFVIGESGPELVNYRVRGRFYVVDRMFDRAEMRLGDRRQRVVRIDRQHTATERAANG
ncbi:MAG TPA: P-type conjugative transfer protein TrbG [Caulobacterales bacterium]|nr:P-type conjugative transfer protein TrbG [Caulobacterales bacterium]